MSKLQHKTENSQEKDPKINSEIATLSAQNQELLQDLQRTRADFENFRKQTDLQRLQTKQLAEDATIAKILPLLDDLDRAIAAQPEHLSPLQKTFAAKLKELNLTKIDTAVGTDFNPDFHEAISMEDGSGAKEVILETLRPGYLYKNQVLRPAMVRVKSI